MERGKKRNIVCPKQKQKKKIDFFPNNGPCLLVLYSYLKIMNRVRLSILDPVIEIAFLLYFMQPHPFHKSFYLV
jgi:hypothetical protein